MRSKEDGKFIYSTDIKCDGNRKNVKITKSEYKCFNIGDTIKAIKENPIDEIEKPNDCTNGYKIVTIGGENYLVIKLQNNIIINDTTNFK